MIERFFETTLNSPWDSPLGFWRRSAPVWQSYTHQAAESVPHLNVSANDDEIHITSELPGLKAEDLEISVQGSTLTLRGTHKAQKAEAEETILRTERPQGQFERTFDLPYRIDAEKVEAAIKQGVLTIVLRRPEADKPRKIAIRTQH